MEKKKRKNGILRSIVYILVLAVIFAAAINPQLLWFLNAETQELIAASVRNTFGAPMSDGEPALTLPKIVTLIAVIALVLLVSAVLRFIIRSSRFRGRRTKTVAELVLNVVSYATVLIIVIWGLTIIGVNVTAVFAGLGIVGLIIGFGAERLIEDVITGIFAIFEGQYAVGDIIVLDDFRGVVKRIGVRTTTIEDLGGNQKIVNNSDIRNLQNRSRTPSYAVTDVGISYGTRVEVAEEILNANLPALKDKYPALFLEPPKYAGVQALGDSAVILRVLALTSEENVFSAQRTLNREVKIIFDNNDLEIPFMQVVLHDGGANEPKK